MDKKLNLLFDASILANAATKNANRSGIFVTAYKTLESLIRQKKIHVSLYVQPQKYMQFKKQIKEFLPAISDLKLYPKFSFYTYVIANLKHKKAKAKRDGKILKKILYHYVCFSIKSITFPFKFALKNKYNFLKEIDLFLSPVEKCPKEILDRSHIQHYTILYDTIPLLYPEYYPQTKSGKYWIQELMSIIGKDSKGKYFAISEQTKKDFLKFVPELKPEQITVTPLACSDSFHPCSKEETLRSLQKYHLPTDKKYVFSLCSLEPRKNLIRAVKTFIEFIKKNNIDDMVFILGGGHWEDFIGKLDKEIEGLGEYKNKIIKAGYIDDEDLAPLYSGAEWFVYTSQYEGFGLPPLEAMACGCPVITSNNSSLPEVVGDAGIMIDWDSDEQHIKAYEDYYFHPELCEQNRAKGLARAKQFSWDKTVDLMVKEMVE